MRNQESEIRKNLDRAVTSVLNLTGKIAKKLKSAGVNDIESLKSDYVYGDKLFVLATSVENVQWAYGMLAGKNLLPEALESVRRCMQELLGYLTELVKEGETKL